MKYAIRFYHGCRVLNAADEIIIKYWEREPQLIKFVQSRPQEQRIVVDICPMLRDLMYEQPSELVNENLDIFRNAYQLHPNFAIKLDREEKWIEVLKEEGIPFFFDYCVKNSTELADILKFGVSDVYIGEDLGFSLDKVYILCKQNNVNIRVYPNLAQKNIAWGNGKRSITSFFIRPEDVEFYSRYVDTFEFYGNLQQQDVYYDIYKEGRWLGNLQDIIFYLSDEIDSRTILPSFTKRATCDKKCNYGKCDICGNLLSAGKLMKDKGLLMIPDKKESIVDQKTIQLADEMFAKYVE